MSRSSWNLPVNSISASMPLMTSSKPLQNPTLGLLIRNDKKETDVQSAFKGISTPFGIATYDNIREKEIQDQHPSIEERTKRILPQDELNKA